MEKEEENGKVLENLFKMTKNKRGSTWLWIILIIILIVVGIGLYLWFSSGEAGSLIGGSSIPSPPPLPE